LHGAPPAFLAAGRPRGGDYNGAARGL
jgi:hypothetical protein